ncbi:MAG TPA: hypothetical protein DD727_07865 [Clostridiales bacterium]|nr:hypothetical protein [Clostridiales bacterium]
MKQGRDKKLIRTFLDAVIGLITLMVFFVLIYDASRPVKYALVEGEKSQIDIAAPRDIIN